jgi:plastocyanin
MSRLPPRVLALRWVQRRTVLLGIGMPLRLTVPICCSLALFGACSSSKTNDSTPSRPAAPTDRLGRATLSGHVHLQGTPPAALVIMPTADPYCLQRHPGGIATRSLQVGADGALADVVVAVKSGLRGRYPLSTTPVALDQEGCVFRPHVLAVAVGQPISIRSADDTLHNVRPMAKLNEDFNLPQPRRGSEHTKRFDKPERMIPIVCDVHSWMRAYVSVFDHPFYAVTDAQGAYSISGLPGGDYEVEVIHESLPGLTQPVHLADGGAGTMDFELRIP